MVQVHHLVPEEIKIVEVLQPWPRSKSHHLCVSSLVSLRVAVNIGALATTKEQG